MTVTITDPFEINEKKLELEALVIQALLEVFPDHRIGTIRNFRGYTTYHFTDNGKPTHAEISNAITESTFCLIGPEPVDTRKKLFGISSEEAPRADVVGAIKITFKENSAFLKLVKIEIFGLTNKLQMIQFTKRFETGDLWACTGNVEVVVASSEPKKVN